MPKITKPVIVFLDFDGVIRNRGWRSEWIENVNTLVQEFDAQIVVTSDWRHSHRRVELMCELQRRGIKRWNSIDETPILLATLEMDDPHWYEPRYTEIATWLSSNDFRGAYVILDDMQPLKTTEYGPRMVLCNYDSGFGIGELEQAREILKQQIQ